MISFKSDKNRELYESLSEEGKKIYQETLERLKEERDLKNTLYISAMMDGLSPAGKKAFYRMITSLDHQGADERPPESGTPTELDTGGQDNLPDTTGNTAVAKKKAPRVFINRRELL